MKVGEWSGAWEKAPVQLKEEVAELKSNTYVQLCERSCSRSHIW